MVASSAAKAAPVRPAITTAVITAAISRATAMPTRSATKMPAPNLISCTAPTNARIAPTSTLTTVTIGTARALQSVVMRAKSRHPKAPAAAQPGGAGHQHMAEEGDCARREQGPQQLPKGGDPLHVGRLWRQIGGRVMARGCAGRTLWQRSTQDLGGEDHEDAGRRPA